MCIRDSIKTVEDLKGKSVSIGAANSGVYFNALDVLNAGGITLDDIHPQYLSFEDSKESLKDGNCLLYTSLSPKTTEQLQSATVILWSRFV